MPWRGQIPNLNYYAPEIYSEEQQLFKKNWQFFATIYDFRIDAPRNDGPSVESIQRMIADTTVVLERIDSNLRGYYLVQNHASGPASEIPCDYQLLGPLIFVNLVSCGKTLSSFVESDLSVPSHLLLDIKGKFASLTFKLEANWKVALQNALEDYHIATIHPESFGSEGIMGDEIYGYEKDGRCATSSNFLPEKLWRRYSRYDRQLEMRKVREHYYKTSYIFPNLTLTSMAGLFVWTICYRPTAENKTDMVLDLYNVGDGLPTHHMEAQLEYLRKIYEEDREIVWKVQCGVQQTDRLPTFGDQEERLHWFHECYLSWLSEADSVA